MYVYFVACESERENIDGAIGKFVVTAIDISESNLHGYIHLGDNESEFTSGVPSFLYNTFILKAGISLKMWKLYNIL